MENGLCVLRVCMIKGFGIFCLMLVYLFYFLILVRHN